MSITTISYNDIPSVLMQLLERMEQMANAIQALSTPKTPTQIRPMDVNEAAKFLKVTEQTIYSYAKNGELRHFKKGKKLYFYESDLVDWLEEGRVKTKAQIEAEVNNTIAKYAK